MSTALFAVPGVLAPLHGFWRRFISTATPHPAQTQHFVESGLAPIPRPLRVVRIVEVGQAPTHVGRMTISGRMSDVCAELDRMAALH
jgi:hypothetical protein